MFRGQEKQEREIECGDDRHGGHQVVMLMDDEYFGSPDGKRRKELWLVLFTGFLALLFFVIEIGMRCDNINNKETITSMSAETFEVLLKRRSTAGGAMMERAVTSPTRKPMVGDSWDYLLSQKATSTSGNGVKFISIDLFDNDKATISTLQSKGTFVACYFSAGTYENWRPDKSKFPKKALGKALDGWAGERWIDTKSTQVRQIMLSRMDLAVSKGCNGLDPDNIDGYSNKNGLGLKKQDAINYVKFLANAAKSRKLLIGLKNGGDIIPNVINQIDYSINEQCSAYDECDLYQPFIKAGKPVFHVEYPKGDSTNNNNAVKDTAKYCKDPKATGFSTILKNMNLNAWVQNC